MLNLVLVFRILAVGLAIATVFFLWKGENDNFFVSAVFAVCSYLLSLRFQIKARIEERKKDQEED